MCFVFMFKRFYNVYKYIIIKGRLRNIQVIHYYLIKCYLNRLSEDGYKYILVIYRAITI